MADERDPLLVAVAERMHNRVAELVTRQLDALRRFRSYDRVPDDDLARSCERNVARVVATLEQRDRLPSTIEEDERASGQRRALQGVPSEDVAAAYRAVLAVLRDAFAEDAAHEGADPAAVLEGTRRLWDLTDRYSSVLVAARQQVDIDAARRDERERMALLQRLLVGGVEPGDLAPGAAVHGVLSAQQYIVLRGRDHSAEPQRLARHLEGRGRGRALIAPFDEDVVGLVSEAPDPLTDAVIAVAGPVPLTGVPTAFAEASRVLAAALRYRRTGIVDSSSLSVRVAVEQQAELGEQLHRRYVAPFVGSAAGDPLLSTVRTYLTERRSVAAAAQSLGVHENTVRYRLERYRELSGADLADSDRLVEVWWALEYHSIRS